MENINTFNGTITSEKPCVRKNSNGTKSILVTAKDKTGRELTFSHYVKNGNETEFQKAVLNNVCLNGVMGDIKLNSDNPYKHAKNVCVKYTTKTIADKTYNNIVDIWIDRPANVIANKSHNLFSYESRMEQELCATDANHFVLSTRMHDTYGLEYDGDCGRIYIKVDNRPDLPLIEMKKANDAELVAEMFAHDAEFIKSFQTIHKKLAAHFFTSTGDPNLINLRAAEDAIFNRHDIGSYTIDGITIAPSGIEIPCITGEYLSITTSLFLNGRTTDIEICVGQNYGWHYWNESSMKNLRNYTINIFRIINAIGRLLQKDADEIKSKKHTVLDKNIDAKRLAEIEARVSQLYDNTSNKTVQPVKTNDDLLPEEADLINKLRNTLGFSDSKAYLEKLAAMAS